MAKKRNINGSNMARAAIMDNKALSGGRLKERRRAIWNKAMALGLHHYSLQHLATHCRRFTRSTTRRRCCLHFTHSAALFISSPAHVSLRHARGHCSFRASRVAPAWLASQRWIVDLADIARKKTRIFMARAMARQAQRCKERVGYGISDTKADMNGISGRRHRKDRTHTFPHCSPLTATLGPKSTHTMAQHRWADQPAGIMEQTAFYRSLCSKRSGHRGEKNSDARAARLVFSSPRTAPRALSSAWHLRSFALFCCRAVILFHSCASVCLA